MGLTEKKGIYYAVTKYKESDGKWKTKFISTKIKVSDHRKKEAKEITAKLIADFNSSLCGDHSQLTISEYSEIWFEHMKPIIRSNTMDSYKRDMNRHVIPLLGKKKINQLHQKDVENFIHQEIRICDERAKAQAIIRADAEAKGEIPKFAAQFSPFYKSIKKHVNVLSEMLNYAVSVDDVQYNVADKIDKSIFRKLAGDKFRGSAYTMEETAELQRLVMGTEIEVPVMLALMLALRRSEVIGLRWSAIDFEDNIVHINHTCIIEDNKPKYVDLTKNSSSRTDMYLAENVKAYLLSVRMHQEEDKKLFGKGYKDSDYICRYADGTLMKPNYVSHNFKRFLERNHLRAIRFHDLRHTAGSTILNQTGDLKLTSEYLRHSSIQVTGDIYSHVDMGRKKAAADILAANIVTNNESNF